MISRNFRCVVFAAVALTFGALVCPAEVAPKKVLFFSKSSGFEHEAIQLKMKDGRRGFAFDTLEQLGRDAAIEFTFSKDGSLITAEYLAQFDAFCFYTSGMLTELGTDQNPAMTLDGKAALLAAVAGGKGFIGLHIATDSFHSPGSDPKGPARYKNDGEATDPYVKMLGAEFILHDKQQTARQIVIDRTFPGMSAIPSDYSLLEEWYSHKNFAPDLHVLLVQETKGMVGSHYERPPYPSTWARLHGKGRVFYTSMGHREDIWQSAEFQSLLRGGLNWALQRVDADVTPNLLQVTPDANVLPRYVAPR